MIKKDTLLKPEMLLSDICNAVGFRRSLIILSIIFTGCSGYQYVAPAHIVPVNNEKGHCTGNLSNNTCQLDYTFSNHFSIYSMLNYRSNHKGIVQYDFSLKDTAGFSKKDEHFELDLGITYFRNYGNHFSMEILTGLGYGKVRYENLYYIPNIYEFSFTAGKMEYSIQSNFSIRYEDYIDFSVFSRINYNRYFNIESTFESGPSREMENYDKYFHDRNHADLYFFEPGFQLRFGLKYIKLFVQLANSFELSSSEIYFARTRWYAGISCSRDLITD